MAPKRARSRPTRAIIEVARGQHGVVAAAQLVDLGISRDHFRHRVAAGWLVRLHRGIYAVGGRAVSWRGRWMAAVLACGEGTLLSHAAAAALWRLAPARKGAVDVTVPGHAGRRGTAGIRVHRSTTLTDNDRSQHDGIPVTSPRRTIIDLAASGTSGRPLERILDEADRLGHLGPATFTAGVEPGRRPLPASLRKLLSEHAAGSTLTRSELEERFLALCREQRLTPPLVNAELLGLTVDFLWPIAALVVELDGRAGHDTRRAFQDDRDRDSTLAAAGFRTLRFTWWDVSRRPAVVADRVGRLLDQANPRGRVRRR